MGLRPQFRFDLTTAGVQQIWRLRGFSGKTFVEGIDQYGFLDVFVVFATQPCWFHCAEVVVFTPHAQRCVEFALDLARLEGSSDGTRERLRTLHSAMPND